jgi:hypothetical protein
MSIKIYYPSLYKSQILNKLIGIVKLAVNKSLSMEIFIVVMTLFFVQETAEIDI